MSDQLTTTPRHGLTLTDDQARVARDLFHHCYEGFDELWTLAHAVDARREIDDCRGSPALDSLLDMLAARAMSTASTMSQAFSDLEQILSGDAGAEVLEFARRNLRVATRDRI